jgi:hypothetical protein
MEYPINYDFGKNWNKIKHHMDNPLIKKGVNKYLKDQGFIVKYVENTAPVKYSSRDSYVTLLDRRFEIIKDKKLPKKWYDIEKKFVKACDENDGVMNEYSLLMFEIENEVREKYFSWENEKYNLESYDFVGACHWWAPTFCLTLAKLVEPLEDWIVRYGLNHTTVVNKEKSKVFDIAFWCIDDRLENYIFGTKLDKKGKDPTLGGKQAYIDSEEE